MPLRATVSLDLDDLWTYLKTRGDERWVTYPSYLSTFVPRVLDMLDLLGLRITVFVVGQDAADPDKALWLRAIALRGHEIASHSFAHDCWLHQYSAADLDRELARAEEAIESATGHRPTGFRAPGFSWSPVLPEVLSRRGYRYDASTLPTMLGPLARAYFLRSARLNRQQREQRSGLFGSFSEATRPLRPYTWAVGDGRQLLEIPVTTMPFTRIPFHLSYLVYLRGFSWALMAAHLRMSLGLCRAVGLEPSFLLHPLDILDALEAPGLEFFPGMRLAKEEKKTVFCYALQTIQKQFETTLMGEFAQTHDRSRPVAARPYAEVP